VKERKIGKKEKREDLNKKEVDYSLSSDQKKRGSIRERQRVESPGTTTEGAGEVGGSVVGEVEGSVVGERAEER